MSIKQFINNGSLVYLGMVCMGMSDAYAAVKAVEGPTYHVPAPFAKSASTIQFSQEQIHKLSEQTTQLKPKKGGFPGLSTKITHCQQGYSKQVDRQHLLHPLFVVGDDSASLQWLKRHRQALQASHAIGLIIQASSIDSLQKIQAAAGHLALYPAKAKAVSERFGVDCYPVLISQHLIEG